MVSGQFVGDILQRFERQNLMAIKSYRELIVWQKAMDLVVDVYKKTKAFPRATDH